VFENGLLELDSAGTLAVAETNERVLITAETPAITPQAAITSVGELIS
jgi:hypothetical protein